MKHNYKVPSQQHLDYYWLNTRITALPSWNKINHHLSITTFVSTRAELSTCDKDNMT
jgi:hypothetical protein